MPSFDIVSKIDTHELQNAINQANREIANRFDFKGTSSRVDKKDMELTLIAPNSFQVRQIGDILQTKLSKRDINTKCLQIENIKEANNEAKQTMHIKHGIDKELAKLIITHIKKSKLKLQSNIQDDQIRVTGKKRDDLQQIIDSIKNLDIDQPLQFINFRD